MPGAVRTDAPDEPPRILTFVLEMPIRWGDMDALRHVNNTAYFRYMEQTRISWFDRIGIAPDPVGEGPVIVNAACTFLRQLEYPGTVVLHHYVGAFGRSSVETMVDMSRSDQPGVVHARGAAKIVWVDLLRRRSAPLPDRVRELMRRPWTGG